MTTVVAYDAHLLPVMSPSANPLASVPPSRATPTSRPATAPLAGPNARPAESTPKSGQATPRFCSAANA